MKYSMFAVLCAFMVATYVPSAFADSPAIFTDRSFEQAQTAASEQERLLIVDATAVWCGPCKQMDRSTWINSSVTDWLGEHAIAIQVDVDEEHEVSEELGITAMPTVIAFRNGKEIDRFVGYRDADATLEWLNLVIDGKTEVDRLRELAGDRADADGNIDIQARLDLAQSLLERRLFPEATDEYVWLWNNMLDFDPAFLGVRLSFMATELESLVQQHQPAHKEFTTIRDALANQLRASDADFFDLRDWITLNTVLDQNDRTIAWVDRVKDRPESSKAFRQVFFLLSDLMIENDRWDLAGVVQGNLVVAARREIAMYNMTMQSLEQGDFDPSTLTEIQNYQSEDLVESIAKIYAAALASDHADSADEVAAMLLEHQNTADVRVALVTFALEAHAADQSHLRWLDEAEQMGADVTDLRRQILDLDQSSP